LLTAFSCKEEKPNNQGGFSSIFLEDKNIDYKEALVGRFWITALSDWNVICQEDWLIIDPKSGPAGSHKVTITATENKDYLHDRTAVVTFSCGDESREMTVTQSKGPIVDPVEPEPGPEPEPEPVESSQEPAIPDPDPDVVILSRGDWNAIRAAVSILYQAVKKYESGEDNG
jgi:hypothetical protein